MSSAARRSRVERLVGARPPRRSALLLALPLAAAVAAAALLPAPAAVAPVLLGAVLAGLWCGPTGRLLVPVLGAAALLPARLQVPSVSQLAAAAGAAVALAAVAWVVAGCARAAAAARTSALQTAVAREDDVRAAQRSQQELTGQLHYWATHDALTGVLNRTAFLRQVDAALASGQPIGLQVISLAGFATVNEQLGDPFGDAALGELARRLGATARGGDVTARLGGDSFGVLLCGLPEGNAAAVGSRVLSALDEPFAAGADSVLLRARSGLAVLPVGVETTARELLRTAEAATRAAVVGQPPVVVSGADRPVTGETGSGETGLTEADLARGLGAGELFLLYQPLVSGASGQITAVEALVRWRHPVHGLVPPDAFIGLAERTGLILPLGLHVLDLACRQLADWGQSAPQLTVAVNVSARQLVEPGFVDDVRSILWGSRVDPARLVLELTESLLVDDNEAASAIMWQLRSLGVRLALDDFGTGYSSLARLGDLPLDEMKIDKSFVDRLGALPRDSATLVTAAVAMGHGLGLEVVAEGVETVEQAVFLREVGCDLLQGYLFGRPQPAAEITSQIGRPLLAPPSAIPAPRPDADATENRVVVPQVMPSMEPRRGS